MPTKIDWDGPWRIVRRKSFPTRYERKLILCHCCGKHILVTVRRSQEVHLHATSWFWCARRDGWDSIKYGHIRYFCDAKKAAEEVARTAVREHGK
jgi:hypothetical protein